MIFLLHNSFAEPRRELLQQPFELTEMGWGEFEIAVQVQSHSAAHESFSASLIFQVLLSMRITLTVLLLTLPMQSHSCYTAP